MNVFDEAAPGRKQCSDCKKYVAARTSTCACGHVFYEKLVKEPKEPKAPRVSVPKEIKPPSIFDEAGKGRKQCGSCFKYVGLRTIVCPNCSGTSFPSKKAEVVSDTVVAFDEPGKNRKCCHSCGKYVNIHVLQCLCGAEFAEEVVRVKKEADLPEVAYVPTYAEKGERVIDTPAFDCPCKLTGNDEESILNWMDRVVASGIKEHIRYSLKALRYFVRQFHDMYSPEWEYACNVIDSHGI